MNLDPSLAFTALLKIWPGYADGTDDGGSSVVAALARDMTAASPPDRWQFAAGWIAATRAVAEVVDAEIIDDVPPGDPAPAEPGAWESIAETLATMGVDVCRAADDLHRIAEALENRP